MAYQERYAWSGLGGWSIDGLGSESPWGGGISCVVPVGSTVEKALLYATRTVLDGQIPAMCAPTVNFDGTTITQAQFTACGEYYGVDVGAGFLRHQAYVRDVTAQVAADVGGGSASPFTFNIVAEYPDVSPTAEAGFNCVPGCALVVVYSNPASPDVGIVLVDGANTPEEGDGAITVYCDPLPAPASSTFEMSVGISFSFLPGQTSQINVNGRRLSSNAGGYDDGFLTNPSLLTIGGIGDSNGNPDDPLVADQGSTYDNELYNLAAGNTIDATSYLAQNATSFAADWLDATAASDGWDDLLFFVGLKFDGVRLSLSALPDLWPSGADDECD